MIVALGLLAGLLTTAAWLPQLARTWRSGRADDISWAYLLVFGSGVATWLAYGVVDDQPAVVIANAATLVLVAGLIGLKAWPRRPLPVGVTASDPLDEALVA